MSILPSSRLSILLRKSLCSVNRQFNASAARTSDRFQLSFSANNGTLFAAQILAPEGD